MNDFNSYCGTAWCNSATGYSDHSAGYGLSSCVVFIWGFQRWSKDSVDEGWWFVQYVMVTQ